MINLASEQGFNIGLTLGTSLQGVALAEQGQIEEGIAQIQEALAAYRATGAKLTEPYFLAHLAEAYGKVGQMDKGLRVLAEALAVVDSTRERIYEAELHRLKETLTLQSEVKGPKSKVEKRAQECFWKAVEIPPASRRSRWN